MKVASLKLTGEARYFSSWATVNQANDGFGGHFGAETPPAAATAAELMPIKIKEIGSSGATSTSDPQISY
jgi:hypothetical protein